MSVKNANSQMGINSNCNLNSMGIHIIDSKMIQCHFCESYETKYCNWCDKYMCENCRKNYPARIKAMFKSILRAD